jgi:hypothetical protein
MSSIEMYRTNRAEYQYMLLSSYSRSLPTLKYWNRQQQINNVNAVQTKHNSVYIDRSFIKTLDGVYSREERYQDPLRDAEPAVLDYFGQLMRRQENIDCPIACYTSVDIPLKKLHQLFPFETEELVLVGDPRIPAAEIVSVRGPGNIVISHTHTHTHTHTCLHGNIHR